MTSLPEGEISYFLGFLPLINLRMLIESGLGFSWSEKKTKSSPFFSSSTSLFFSYLISKVSVVTNYLAFSS